MLYLNSLSHPVSIIDVAAGLVFRRGRLLITKRHTSAHLGGLWEFPGGKRESDESFENCLVRELREELGVEVEICELLERLTHEYPEKSVHIRFYRCRWLQHEPQALGCAEFRWVTPDELSTFAFPAADARLLGHLATAPNLWLSK